MDLTLPVLLSLLSAAAVFLGCMTFARGLAVHLDRRERRFAADLNELFLLDFSPRFAAQLSLASVVVGAVAAGLMMDHPLGVPIGGALGYALPGWYVGRLRARRRERLERQLTDAMLTIANGVRANLNLVQSMRLVEENAPPPVGQEFGLMLREYEHGLAIEDAMAKAAQRLGSPNYRLMFSALQMHREKGGDLPTLLDRLAESLRELQRLEEKAKTVTAQGRLAARMMGAMPPVMLGILWIIDREGVAILFGDPRGNLILALVVLLWLAGFMWIRRIVRIDI
ncbi:MAG: type II secretion system F family protein [Phycisphaerae bacterium]|nr:type II secretion system F family protein [Phycisphaerae bacterium]NUQ46830.1 type II secretion system F family protein [Phycisphaerae bacterium]